MSWLLDTNVVSEMMRPCPEPRVARFLDGIATHVLHVSAITSPLGLDLLPLTVIQQYGYHDPMKATIDIPDDLYRQVKSEAALRGLTIRKVTTELYRRWLSGGEGREAGEAPAAWLHSWMNAADEAMSRAPPGRPARAELDADRSRLLRG